MEKTYEELKRSIAQDPGCSYWIREAVQVLDRRDPVDAWKDAATLMRLQELRLKEVQG